MKATLKDTVDGIVNDILTIEPQVGIVIVGSMAGMIAIFVILVYNIIIML